MFRKCILSFMLTMILTVSTSGISKGKSPITDNERAMKLREVKYKTIKVDGLDIFYRDQLKPTIMLLHGYPSSSHMYHELIRKLSGEYHLIALIIQASDKVACNE